jgi:hypothetical protein
MPSGYFDSVHVPLHLPPSAYQPPATATKNAKDKGKGKQLAAADTPPAAAKYNVVEQWTAQERDDMLRKVTLASLRRCTHVPVPRESS